MIQQPISIDSPREELIQRCRELEADVAALLKSNQELQRKMSDSEAQRLRIAITDAAMAFNALFEITNMAPRK